MFSLSLGRRVPYRSRTGSSGCIGFIAPHAAHVRPTDDLSDVRSRSFRVSIRSVCSSAAAALGIGWSAWSSSAFAGTVFVHAAYVPSTVVYAPRPVYAPPPAYVALATVTAVTVVAPAKPLPYAAVPIPVPVPVPVVAVPAAVPVAAAPVAGYAVVPAVSVVYTQPVLAVPAVAAPR
jgi:hypothetical protein